MQNHTPEASNDGEIHRALRKDEVNPSGSAVATPLHPSPSPLSPPHSSHELQHSDHPEVVVLQKPERLTSEKQTCNSGK